MKFFVSWIHFVVDDVSLVVVFFSLPMPATDSGGTCRLFFSLFLLDESFDKKWFIFFILASFNSFVIMMMKLPVFFLVFMSNFDNQINRKGIMNYEFFLSSFLFIFD